MKVFWNKKKQQYPSNVKTDIHSTYQDIISFILSDKDDGNGAHLFHIRVTPDVFHSFDGYQSYENSYNKILDFYKDNILYCSVILILP